MNKDRPPPRDRVLQTATELFYLHGIRAVGIDRVVAESEASKLSLYRHFPSKAALVTATLAARDVPMRALLEHLAVASGATPRAQLVGLFKSLETWFESPGFRGCRFTNAALEMADEDDDVLDAARRHKEEVRRMFERLARAAELRRPAELSRQLMIVYDGAIVTALVQKDPAVARTAAAAARALVDSHL